MYVRLNIMCTVCTVCVCTYIQYVCECVCTYVCTYTFTHYIHVCAMHMRGVCLSVSLCSLYVCVC